MAALHLMKVILIPVALALLLACLLSPFTNFLRRVLPLSATGASLYDSANVNAVLPDGSHSLEAIRRHTWPGNIRELINRVRRAIVMCDGNWISPRDLDLDRANGEEMLVLALDKARQNAERQALRQALKISSNNYSAAARMLGVSRVTLYRLIEKHRLGSGPNPG